MSGAKLSPLSVGVTMITGPYADHAPAVHALIVSALLDGSTELPLAMPRDLMVYDVISGSPRQLECQQTTRELIGISGEFNKRLKIKTFRVPTQINWSDAGSVGIVSKQMELKSGSAIVLQQPPKTELAADGVWQLRMEARESENRVILMAPHPKEHMASSHLPVDEVLHVTPCDPNPDYEQAFVIAYPELNSGWGADSGKVMCCLSTESGVFKATYSAYVSDSLKVRLMSALRSRDWTMAKIGKAMEQNKSTVSRALKGVPKFDASEWDQEELAKWFEACDLDPALIETVEKFEADQEVEADIGPDELDESVGEEQVVAEKDRNTRNTCNTPKKRR